MDWIMMQPTYDDKSIASTALLLKAGECKFNLTKSGAHIRPTSFGSRSCVAKEKNITLLLGRLHAGVGLSAKTVDFYGAHTSGGCAAVKRLRKY